MSFLGKITGKSSSSSSPAERSRMSPAEKAEATVGEMRRKQREIKDPARRADYQMGIDSIQGLLDDGQLSTERPPDPYA